MKHFVKNHHFSKNEFIHTYSGINEDDLSSKAMDLLISLGYKVKEENLGLITYEKGNRVLRIILGAFYKYFKFEVSAEEVKECTRLTIRTETSGMSGGLIGMNQVKKEVIRLGNLFQKI